MRLLAFILLSVFAVSLRYSQSIYHRDATTVLADSLHQNGAYKQAILYRKQALENHKDTSKDYQLFLKAKYEHTKSCDYESESIFKLT